jgi:SAM-dependent methyltransferase
VLTTRLYGALAGWWPLLSDPADYKGEASFFVAVLREASSGPLETMLELGSGGGNNASHLKRSFECTLVDLSPGMIEVSRKLNPECEHFVDDLRTFRIERTFDVVFVHDAIMYLTTEADLARALATCAVHCRPGGVVLLVPDCVRETYKPATDSGGHDGSDGRALRYLEWTWDPDPTDDTIVTDFAYLLRDADGLVTVEHDRHIFGLFSRAVWLKLLRAAGLQPQIVRDEWQRELFVAAKPE